MKVTHVSTLVGRHVSWLLSDFYNTNLVYGTLYAQKVGEILWTRWTPRLIVYAHNKLVGLALVLDPQQSRPCPIVKSVRPPGVLNPYPWGFRWDGPACAHTHPEGTTFEPA
jgi:hypothetical protein